MKYIICSCYNEGDWFNKNVALVAISDELKDLVKLGQDYLDKAPGKIRDYIEVGIPMSHLNTFNGFIAEDIEDYEVNEDIKKVYTWLVREEATYIEIEDISNLDVLIGEVERTECATLTLDKYGVVFSCRNKYGDMEEIYTNPIDVKAVFNY